MEIGFYPHLFVCLQYEMEVFYYCIDSATAILQQHRDERA